MALCDNGDHANHRVFVFGQFNAIDVIVKSQES
jgi:hypothetical protein